MNVTLDELGDFAVFGFNKEFNYLLKRRFADRLKLIPRSIEFGTAGSFFFYTSYGDVAESEEAIALKLGSLRSLTLSSLSAQQLLV